LTHFFTGNERSITKNTIYSLKNPEVYSNTKIKETLQFEFKTLDETIQFSAALFIREEQHRL